MRGLAVAAVLLLAAGVVTIPNAPSVVAAPAARSPDPARSFAAMIAMCTAEPKGCAPVRPRPRPSRGGARSGDVWSALARCESGGNPQAVSASGTYRGLLQFSLATWRSVGMTGDPIDHTAEEQIAAAQRLQARSGFGQWPRCARRLGLL